MTIMANSPTVEIGENFFPQPGIMNFKCQIRRPELYQATVWVQDTEHGNILFLNMTFFKRVTITK